LTVGVEEGLYGLGFGLVLVGGAAEVAGGHALLHLAVGAAGVRGRDVEVLVAAAELEEVEDGVAVALGGGAGGEGAVHLGERFFGEAVSGVDAGVGVLNCQPQEEGRVEAHAAAGFGVAEGHG